MGVALSDIRDVFDARAYLAEYFAAPSDEDEFTLAFWIRQILQLEEGAHVLEYGGGPTLYGTLALARVARSIHFSDHVPDSLEEVRRWAAGEPGAYDWSAYTRLVLLLEGDQATEAEVAEREERLRNVLGPLTLCDARAAEMLDDARPPYDVIGAHHCLDVAARDPEEFAQMTARLARWLTPGGLFLLSVSTGATRYTVEGVPFSCLSLDSDQVEAALTGAGLSRVEQAELPVAGEEYDGVLLSAAWKA